MNLQSFEHEEFGVIRTVEVDGRIYFAAADVCRALGSVESEVARLEGNERALFDLGASYGEVFCVDEVGLYKLFRKSTKTNAINFHRWIYNKVIPAHYKKDYSKLAANPDFIIEVGKALKAEKEKAAQLTAKNAALKKQIAELTPQETYIDVVLKRKAKVAASVIAEDYGMTAIQFNQLLQELGVQEKKDGVWLPRPEYEKLGWMVIQPITQCDPAGKIFTKIHSFWTQKGRLGLYELLKDNGYLPLIEIK